MEIIPIRKNTKTAEEAKAIYLATFPQDEQTSFERLLELSTDDSARFVACYDKQVFISFVFYVESAEYVFGLFFAVDPQLQGKGYGRAVFKAVIGNKMAEKTVMFDVEDPEQETDDTGNRIRRLKFYEGFGMHQTKYRLWNGDVMFRVLSTTGKGDIWQYIDFLDKFCGCSADGTPLTYTVYQDGVDEPMQRPPK